jgi:hypothetical protein
MTASGQFTARLETRPAARHGDRWRYAANTIPIIPTTDTSSAPGTTNRNQRP